MASNLYINEYQNMGVTKNFSDPVLAPYSVPIATQQLAITGASVKSAVFNTLTKFVMLNASAACSLDWKAGDTAVAVATAERLSANETRFYAVNPGGTVAVISNGDT